LAAAADDSDLTPEQVAKDQQISVKKVYEMAVQRKLPAVKVGKYWRFPRAEYLRWKERRR
jgi:excisionase family DNA binding protein